MSRGSKNGPARPAAPAVPQVIVVRPPDAAESREQKELRLAVDLAARRYGLRVPPPRTAQIFKVRGGPAQGSPFFVLTPRDAGDLYASAHRRPTAVLATASVHVRPDPSQPEPATYRHLLALDAFVRHKAFFALIRDAADVPAALVAAAAWPPAAPPAGQKDPRMLPLHAFCQGDPWGDLDAPAGQSRFTRLHRAGAGWQDECGRAWHADPSLHGRDSLTVAGQPLPAGFHWDVRNGGPGATRLTTATEVWSLEQRGAHANVYPDAYVRKGEQARGACVLRWPKR